jgi:hypothetical protein
MEVVPVEVSGDRCRKGVNRRHKQLLTPPLIKI